MKKISVTTVAQLQNPASIPITRMEEKTCTAKDKLIKKLDAIPAKQFDNMQYFQIYDIATTIGNTLDKLYGGTAFIDIFELPHYRNSIIGGTTCVYCGDTLNGLFLKKCNGRAAYVMQVQRKIDELLTGITQDMFNQIAPEMIAEYARISNLNNDSPKYLQCRYPRWRGVALSEKMWNHPKLRSIPFVEGVLKSDSTR